MPWYSWQMPNSDGIGVALLYRVRSMSLPKVGAFEHSAAISWCQNRVRNVRDERAPLVNSA